MKRFVCVHGHFYQPPRENPWLEEIELQDSAYPYHDWNSRITAECYAPNAASRILDTEKKIIDLVNTYSRISFNFGPTLLSWMARREPETYKAILEADKQSQKYFSGHGSAIAQCYNHMIMPLANTKDKRAQVFWGIEDFKRRFNRLPEGMWLPETAVDLETLDIMAEHGIKFTILAPHQAKRVKKLNEKKWQDIDGARIDPRLPYLCRLASGRTIAIFFYDGPIAQDVAFGGLLTNGEDFANRLMSVFSRDGDGAELVHIATDGETYGHHHRFGDMALSYCLYDIESKGRAKITVYGEFLEMFPPVSEVEVFENSSWSCMHGIERWRDNCGCQAGQYPAGKQQWRAPLRGAMDWLRDNLISIYEQHAGELIRAPWTAREHYINVVQDRSQETIDRFISEFCTRALSPDERIKVLKLLEMQRCAMLMYTSCGWFFDEISRIETTQIMQYAARSMQLAKEVSGISLEDSYMGLLRRAPSNIDNLENGFVVYEKFIQATVLDLLRVGVHYAISSLFEDYGQKASIYCYTIESHDRQRFDLGKQRLVIGTAAVKSNITGESTDISFVVLHFGDHNVVGGARAYRGKEQLVTMQEEIKDSFMRAEVSEIVRLIDTHFSTHNYSLWHLFRDEQRKILDQIFDVALSEIENSFRQIYELHYPLMQAVTGICVPLPKYFSTVVEFILNADMRRFFEGDNLNTVRLRKIVGEVQRCGIHLDKVTLSFIISRKINELVSKLSSEDGDLLDNIVIMLRLLEPLGLDLNLWKSQNVYFYISKQMFTQMRLKAEDGDAHAVKWVEHFLQLGEFLKVRIE
ncbi:MAG: DUF3536 domain-containing protein [Candidatus Omnitrophota bacterium]